MRVFRAEDLGHFRFRFWISGLGINFRFVKKDVNPRAYLVWLSVYRVPQVFFFFFYGDFRTSARAPDFQTWRVDWRRAFKLLADCSHVC